jgi:N-acetylmuramoyl-L-alanine amidase
VKGIEINGVAYLPFRAASESIGGSRYSYNSSTRTSTMTAPGLEITVSDGAYVTYANGRALFSTTPNVIMSDGRMYIPVTIFAKAVGMKVDATTSKISITGNYKPLLSADKFYNKDEVFWLARIIHAESRGEALIGQIAVGNVVLNRVKSAYYPNTIYGVIFDRKYGVQFSPVLDGSIYNTPGYSATLAAKICLEGYDVSDGAFFFLNTALATSSWIPKTREYAFTIGNHDFYK